MEQQLRKLAPWGGGMLAVGTLALAAQAATDNVWTGLLALGVGTTLWAALQRAPLERARARAARLLLALESLATGDPEASLLDGVSPDLQPGLQAIREALARATDTGRRHAAQLAAFSERIGGPLREAESSAEAQRAAVEETASLFLNISSSIRRVNQEIQNLAGSNEETAASIVEMGGAIDHVATSSTALRETVEASTASIHEMGASIQQVAESSDEVQQVADETAAATTEMDRAIHEVGEHVRGASTLTRRVGEHAHEGSHAVGSTIQGIDAIRRETLAAKRALEGLAHRIGEVGEIATFIGTISDETNLLSLNAAIIAAQAGEHGKAFAVVADQVKTLSQRTSTSAKQIEEVIRAVQDESENAVRAMAAGIVSVEEGVERSRVAGEALEVILSAADEASGQVAEISRATEEQARNSKHVAGAAQRVSEHVQRISRAMGEQAGAADGLLSNATTYLDMSRQMATAMDQQRATARYIMDNSGAITELIGRIQANTASHEDASAKVNERFERLVETARQSGEQIAEIARELSNEQNHEGIR